MSARILRGFVILVLCFLFVPPVLFGQGTDLGTIRGTVTDATGAVVAKAEVVITDLKTNTSRSTATNGEGAYDVFGLNSGNYVVTVTAPGFEAEKITGIVVAGSAVVGVNAVLRVSAANEKMVVTAEVAEVHTEDQTITQTLTSRAVIDLPRDSRDVYSFLYLNPNITQGPDVGVFKFIGAQSYGASFTLDGQASNGGIFGSQTFSQPSLDAVAEINVLSNDFSAEYGGISNIRVTTKRGGAQYHGSAFYENKNSALATWDVQDKINKAQFAPSPFETKYPTPHFNYNVIGGSLGGPVKGLRNTWFFMAYERDYAAAPLNMTSPSLPGPDLLTGDFSQLNDASKPAVPSDIFPQLTPQEIADDTVGGLGQQFITIPTRLLNPYTGALASKYFPHIGAAAPVDPVTGRVTPYYGTSLPTLSVQDMGTLRLDHDINSNDRVFVVYNGAAHTDDSSQLVQSPYTGLGLTQTVRQNHTLSASYMRVFSGHLVNELRGGFNKQQSYKRSNTTLSGFLSDIGFSPEQIAAYGDVVGTSELSTHGQPAVNFSGAFATFGNGGRNTDRPTSQNLMTFGDTLTWIKGKHNLRIGADAVRNEAVDGFAVNRGNVRGLMTYTGSKTTPLADFLLGEAPQKVSSVLNPRPPMNVHNWEQGTFVQDDWKVKPRLTVNLGLRYEITTPFVDLHSIMVNFDENYVDPQTSQKGRFVAPSLATLQYLSPTVINYGVVTAAQSGLGVGPGLVSQSWDKIAPRLGFAWSLNDKTVLRGGWGLYYPTSAAQGIRDPLATNTFNQAVSKKSVGGVNISPWPKSSSDVTSPITGGVVGGIGNQPSAEVVDFKVKDPRVHQFNVTLEREIGWKSVVRATYLGSLMHRLIATTDLDALPPSTTPWGTTTGDGVTICDPINNGDCNFSAADAAREAFPLIPDGLQKFSNFGHGRSNAFQAEFNHRPSSGLMFSASYTYLDQKSAPADSGDSSLGSVAYNPFNPGADYGEDSYVSHHRFIAYGTYDLPFGHAQRFGGSLPKWLDVVAGDWQTTFSMFAKSGTYFTPFWLCDDCDPVEPGNVGTSSIDAVGDFNTSSYRPTVTGNYKQKVGDQIWNPAAFGPPSVGADLFSGPTAATRNLLQGPGAWGVNFGLHKQVHFGERFALLFGVDVDNLFNHPLFMPTQDFAGGGGTFAQVGDFELGVDQNTGQLLPITASNINLNPLFGNLNTTFSQEGVDSHRTMRLRLRITF